MIEFRESRFTDLLPEHLRTLEVKALAYAVGRQVERLLDWMDRVPVFAGLDAAPESVLDHLAVELRTPAYNEEFPVEVKRTLIQDSLLSYAKMGTPAAINRTIQAIFGFGYIQEWFEYDGEPHHFQAVLQAPDSATQENLDAFYQILSGVKRLSSWLDAIVIGNRRAFRQELALVSGTVASTRLDAPPAGWPEPYPSKRAALYGALCRTRIHPKRID